MAPSSKCSAPLATTFLGYCGSTCQRQIRDCMEELATSRCDAECQGEIIKALKGHKTFVSNVGENAAERLSMTPDLRDAIVTRLADDDFMFTDRVADRLEPGVKNTLKDWKGDLDAWKDGLDAWKDDLDKRVTQDVAAIGTKVRTLDTTMGESAVDLNSKVDALKATTEEALSELNAKMGKITVGESNVNLGTLNSTVGELNAKMGKITVGESNVNLGTLNSTVGALNAKMGKITVGDSEVNLGALKDTVGEHGTTLANVQTDLTSVKATTDHFKFTSNENSRVMEINHGGAKIYLKLENAHNGLWHFWTPRGKTMWIKSP